MGNKIVDWHISKWEFLADLFLVPVYVLVAIIASFYYAEPTWQWLAFFLTGWAIWTLTEYGMHRFLFHGVSDYFRFEHSQHHRRPTDWIGVSSFLMAPIFLVIWAVMVVTASGVGKGGMMFAGYVAGYYGYIVTHLMMHHTNWMIVRQLRRTHDMHHRGVGANYGVSTNFWDRVFGTYLAPEGL